MKDDKTMPGQPTAEELEKRHNDADHSFGDRNAQILPTKNSPPEEEEE